MQAKFLLTTFVACALVACAQQAPAPAPPAPPSSSASGGDCVASGAQFAVGRSADAAVVEQARSRSGARMARTLRPGQAVTMEFNAQRLNLDVDAANVVTRARCG